MNKAIFVTVRTGSKRLPKKALIKIQGKTTVEHLIERVKKAKKPDSIILCTTILKEDDVLCRIAERNEIYFYRGSVKDKLERWSGAATRFGVEFFVTADGDDLFCEPELIDIAFNQYTQNSADFIEGQDIICGAFTYGIKTEALKRVCQIKDTDDTEMMWVYFKDTGMFRVEELHGVDDVFRRPEIRMTLDYPDDLKFFKNIIEELSKTNKSFTLRDIVKYLDANPDVMAINQYLQNEWAENQRKKTKLVIKNNL